MSGIGEEEIERLANRLAMLVSDDGEADNAGRAVGALARRLGLTGGQLKAIFMAGADSAVAQSARVRRLERETVRLRERLGEAESTAEMLQRERDSLLRENEELQAEVASLRQGGRMRWIAALAFVVMLGGGAALVAWGPKLRLGGGEAVAPQQGAPVWRTAIVHDRPAVLRSAPDTGAPALATLAPGTRLTVQRQLWHNLTQWVEVEHDGQTGYVLSTEVDLS